MAFLINRNSSGRLLCLHGLLQYVVHHLGEGPYQINDFKFDHDKKPDIHDFSPCASEVHGFRSCIYLKNPASLAGCGLVNSHAEDTQKSKLASDVFNALDGLGFIRRRENQGYLTTLGRTFAQTSADTHEWEKVARTGVVGYGPFAGLIELVSRIAQDTPWSRSDLSLGFSDTDETVVHDGVAVNLSTGSKSDTITRTRSSLVSWGVATGFFIPRGYENVHGTGPSQIRFWNYLMSSSAPRSLFVNSDSVYEAPDSVVERPLSYDQLTKSTRSLREFGQELQRAASRHWEEKIKNRRLAIAFALHRSAELGMPLDFKRFVNLLSKYPEFVVSSENFGDVMSVEMANAFVIGTPYRVKPGDHLQGVRVVNLEVLCEGASTEVVEILSQFVDQTGLFVE